MLAYTHACIYVCVYIYLCVHVCVHGDFYAGWHIPMHVYIVISMHAGTHPYMCTWSSLCMLDRRAHVCVHLYGHLYGCWHTPMCVYMVISMNAGHAHACVCGHFYACWHTPMCVYMVTSMHAGTHPCMCTWSFLFTLAHTPHTCIHTSSTTNMQNIPAILNHSLKPGMKAYSCKTSI